MGGSRVSVSRYPRRCRELTRRFCTPARLRLERVAARKIVVDPCSRYPNSSMMLGSPMCYGVGVGREGFAWSGTAVIHDKQGMAGLVPAQGDDPAQARSSPST